MVFDHLDKSNTMVRSISYFDNFTKWIILVVNSWGRFLGPSQTWRRRKPACGGARGGGAGGREIVREMEGANEGGREQESSSHCEGEGRRSWHTVPYFWSSMEVWSGTWGPVHLLWRCLGKTVDIADVQSKADVWSWGALFSFLVNLKWETYRSPKIM